MHLATLLRSANQQLI